MPVPLTVSKETWEARISASRSRSLSQGHIRFHITQQGFSKTRARYKTLTMYNSRSEYPQITSPVPLPPQTASGHAGHDTHPDCRARVKGMPSFPFRHLNAVEAHPNAFTTRPLSKMSGRSITLEIVYSLLTCPLPLSSQNTKALTLPVFLAWRVSLAHRP